jgi:predicted nucleotidyltransferase component of viral defense system
VGERQGLIMLKKMMRDEFEEIAGSKPFDNRLIEKDYFVTIILYVLRDIKNIYFKGGTALNKIFLHNARLSEDVDFTVTSNIRTVERDIKNILKKCGFFTAITKDKRVDKFTRLVAHYRGFYEQEGTVFIDLNQSASLLLKPEQHNIPHFYTGHIPHFAVHTVAKREMLAEKMAATIGRNKPRDHFDLYQIVKKKLPLDISLVKKKCESSAHEFNILKMFNRAKKLKNRWDEDMEPLLAEEISFQEVMKSLANHFKLKENKENLNKERK